MTLEDRLREKTFSLKDRLQGIQSEIQRTGLKVSGLERDCQTLQQEVAASSSKIVEKRRDIEQKLREISELEARLTALRSEAEALTQDMMPTEEASRSAETEIKRKRREAEKLEHSKIELVEAKKELDQKIRVETNTSVSEHMRSSEHDFYSLMKGSLDSLEVATAREKFEEDRMSDTVLMDLWEQRLELQKLIDEAKVATVKNLLSTQLQSVEAEVEVRYPGVLVGESSGSAIREIRELYWGKAADDRWHLFLPIKRGAAEMRTGETSHEAEIAARTLWALGSVFATRSSRTEIREGTDWMELVCFSESDLMDGCEDVTVPFPGGGKLSLLMLQLPSEVERAMWRDEEVR